MSGMAPPFRRASNNLEGYASTSSRLRRPMSGKAVPFRQVPLIGGGYASNGCDRLLLKLVQDTRLRSKLRVIQIMKSLPIAFFLILAIASSTDSQTLSDSVAKVRQIKLLESTREDVKRILREYEATDDADHYQTFSNDDLTIEVKYSSGICSEDSDEEDASEIWGVREWTVTRIEIEPTEPIALRNAGLNLTTYKKDPRFPDDTDSLVFHNKAVGIAVKTREDGIENLIFFPPRAHTDKLCRNSRAARGFYTRRGWFSLERPYDYVCVLKNFPANVEEMTLSANEIDETSDPIVSIAANARDPENDVLTYNYKVTAGKIVGNGFRVTWDLTGVAPGAYTITVGVDDGAGIVGKTVTKTVTVK